MAAPLGSRIVTPEAVVLEFEPAGIASRMLAYVLDLIVQAVFLSTVLNVVAPVALVGGVFEGVAAALALVIVFVGLFGYSIAFETLWRGRTLGKAALGLRVVTVEGAPVTFRHAAIRSMFTIVDVLATFGLIGLLSMLFTRRSQRLGDLVAGTLLLRERTSTAASTLRPVRFSAPPGYEGYAEGLATGALSHEDYGVVRAFLLRATSLPAPVRASLATSIARPIARRLRTAPPAEISPESFLLCVAAAYQRRMDGPALHAASRAGGTSFQSVWSRSGGNRADAVGPIASRTTGGGAAAAAGETGEHAGGYVAPA